MVGACSSIPIKPLGFCYHTEEGPLYLGLFTVNSTGDVDLLLLDDPNFENLQHGLPYSALVSLDGVENGTLESERYFCNSKLYLVVLNRSANNSVIITNYCYSTICTSCYFPLDHLTKPWIMLICGAISLVLLIAGAAVYLFWRWAKNEREREETLRLLAS